ncbi:hypothetical protein FGB62_26g11 [Gracilaria domingensis]|nr:hypothetical protein FGB62_26g11 [Gracilaria domingensis]
MPTVVANFEALTPAEQASVPVTAYLRAKAEYPRRVSAAELAALLHSGSTQVNVSPAQAVAATAVAGSSVAVPQESVKMPAAQDAVPVRTDGTQLN